MRFFPASVVSRHSALVVPNQEGVGSIPAKVRNFVLNIIWDIDGAELDYSSILGFESQEFTGVSLIPMIVTNGIKLR